MKKFKIGINVGNSIFVYYIKLESLSDFAQSKTHLLCEMAEYENSVYSDALIKKDEIVYIKEIS
jgi:hypothetical protein